MVCLYCTLSSLCWLHVLDDEAFGEGCIKLAPHGIRFYDIIKGWTLPLSSAFYHVIISEPKSVIRPQDVHSYDSMVLFPNIFYFLIGILLVFVP